jgi:hypothetical protein
MFDAPYTPKADFPLEIENRTGDVSLNEKVPAGNLLIALRMV